MKGNHELHLTGGETPGITQNPASSNALEEMINPATAILPIMPAITQTAAVAVAAQSTPVLLSAENSKSSMKLNILDPLQPLPSNIPSDYSVFLIVDDDAGFKHPVFKMLLEAWCHKQGLRHRIYSVISGQAAVDLIAKGFQCNIIFMDYHLCKRMGNATIPEDGLSITYAIRQHFLSESYVRKVMEYFPRGGDILGMKIAVIMREYISFSADPNDDAVVDTQVMQIAPLAAAIAPAETKTVAEAIHTNTATALLTSNARIPTNPSRLSQPKILGFSDKYHAIHQAYLSDPKSPTASLDLSLLDDFIQIPATPKDFGPKISRFLRPKF